MTLLELHDEVADDLLRAAWLSVAPVEVAGAHWDLRVLPPEDVEAMSEAWRLAAAAVEREPAARAAASAIDAEIREQLRVEGRPRTTAAGVLAAARAISLLTDHEPGRG